MEDFKNTITALLKQYGVEFIHFVDISGLEQKQNRGYPSAILFGVKCSPGYLQRVSKNPVYVPEMVERNCFDDDEHYCHELEMYRIADLLAGFIEENGYSAYSLSDANQIATGNFDGMSSKTLLPLKTLAVHAGLGWIGKNNLLVNKEYGCCQTWGGVLTDVPLEVVLHGKPLVHCGSCRICIGICQPSALKGKTWEPGMAREEMIDVTKCTTCLKCMVHCKYTQRYMARSYSSSEAR